MDPSAGLGGLRDTGLQRVNDTFAGAPQAIQEQFARRGMAKSGKVGQAILGSEARRYGALAGFENDFLSRILEEQQYGLSLAERLLSQNFESETTGSQTIPGNMLGGAVGGGLETLAYMLMRNGGRNGSRGGWTGAAGDGTLFPSGGGGWGYA